MKLIINQKRELLSAEQDTFDHIKQKFYDDVVDRLDLLSIIKYGCSLHKTAEGYTVTEFDFDGNRNIVLYNRCYPTFGKFAVIELPDELKH